MNRTAWLRTGAAVVVLGAGGYAGAMWWSGSTVETGFRARAEALSADPAASMTVTVVSYERSLRGATAVSRVAPRSLPGAFLEFEHSIDHGPHPEFGWGRVETRLRGPGHLKAALDALFGGQPAVTVTSTLPFGGGSITEIVSPPFDRTGGGTRTSWGGLTGRISLGEGNVATFAIQVPSLKVQGGGGVLTVDAISGEGEWNLSGPNSLHWTGRSALRVRSAEAAGPFGRYAVGGVEIEGWQKDEGATLASGFRVAVPSVTKHGDASAEPLVSGFVVAIDAQRIDREALSQFMRETENLQEPDLSVEEQGRRSLEAMARLVDSFAVRSPRLSLTELALDSPNGSLKARGHIEIKPGGPVGKVSDPSTAAATLFGMAGRLSGRAVVELSPALVRFGLEKRMSAAAWAELSRQGEALDETAAAQLAARMAGERLQHMVEAGLLRSEGERLSVEVVLEGGELRLNGLSAAQFMAAVAGPGGDSPAGTGDPAGR